MRLLSLLLLLQAAESITGFDGFRIIHSTSLLRKGHSASITGHVLPSNIEEPIDEEALEHGCDATGARIGSSDAKLDSSQELARNTKLTASKMVWQKETLEPKIQLDLDSVAKTAASSAQYFVDGGGAKRSVQISGKNFVDNSAGSGKEQVTQGVAPLLEQYTDWKFEAMKSPRRAAMRAAAKAAEPYEKALMKVEKSVAQHQQQAEFLNSQAFGLQSIAKATAQTAVKQQSAVDLKGAQANMMLAHQFMAQAGVLGQRAFNLNEAAKALQLNIPAYEGAAQMAAAKAGHWWDPTTMPPVPVAAAAFVPGPPPTGGAIAAPEPPPLWPMAES